MPVFRPKGGGIIKDVYMDNQIWTYPIGEKEKIKPESHSIENSAEDRYIDFIIKSNTVFHFDYWGP